MSPGGHRIQYVASPPPAVSPMAQQQVYTFIDAAPFTINYKSISLEKAFAGDLYPYDAILKACDSERDLHCSQSLC
jgi:hypothetical protein